MGRTCVVGNCKTGYRSDCRKRKHDDVPLIPVFKFPPESDEARQAWIDSLPNILTTEVTEHVGVCELHWPTQYETVVTRGGYRRPRNPPSVWTLPSSFCRQTTTKLHRDVKRRKVSSECRTQASTAQNEIKDTIADWSSLQKYCSHLNDVMVRENNEKIELIKLHGFLPSVSFSISISRDLKVEAFKQQSKVPLRDVIPSFSGRLEKYSQLNDVILKVDSYIVPVRDILQQVSRDLEELIQTRDIEITQKDPLNFLSKQLLLRCSSSNGRRYSAETIRYALNIFFKSRSAYRELRKIVSLPNMVTLKSYFGKLGTPGSNEECKNVIGAVFLKGLDGLQKYCKILIDEIHIKPAVRYSSQHVIGFAIDEPTKPARTVLAIMIAPLLGAPAFVARLLPVYSLNAQFLYEQVVIVIKLIHECSGLVFLVMSDNLRANQSFFRTMHDEFGSVSEWSINHPVCNSVFPCLFLLYDPTHLFKNIRNNWVTEKTKSLRFRDPTTQISDVAKWGDLIDIYKEESLADIKKTNLNYASLYPNNFEKQNVGFAVNIFNEKTVAVLTEKGCLGTRAFVSHITKMWHILNVKSPNAGDLLNDEDRQKINDPNDTRLKYLLQLADAFEEMNPRSLPPPRVNMLTTDTSEALSLTLRGLVDLAKLLLSKGIKYILLGEFQSDRLEGEFGIYRQNAGGNYYISVEQVINGLRLQRLKLFHKLEFESSDVHLQSFCCKDDLTEHEMESLDACFENASMLTEIERATLVYISGYITFKESKKHKVDLDTVVHLSGEEKNCEFLVLVSRGELSLPEKNIFELSLLCYTYYKSLREKCCTTKIVKAFHQIYEASFLHIECIDSVLRRYVNCFSKGYCRRLTDQIKAKNNKNKIKTRRMKSV